MTDITLGFTQLELELGTLGGTLATLPDEADNGCLVFAIEAVLDFLAKASARFCSILSLCSSVSPMVGVTSDCALKICV